MPDISIDGSHEWLSHDAHGKPKAVGATTSVRSQRVVSLAVGAAQGGDLLGKRAGQQGRGARAQLPGNGRRDGRAAVGVHPLPVRPALHAATQTLGDPVPDFAGRHAAEFS